MRRTGSFIWEHQPWCPGGAGGGAWDIDRAQAIGPAPACHWPDAADAYSATPPPPPPPPPPPRTSRPFSQHSHVVAVLCAPRRCRVFIIIFVVIIIIIIIRAFIVHRGLQYNSTRHKHSVSFD